MRTVVPDNAVLVPANAQRVFKGILYDVYHWQQKLFDGSSATFEMLKRPDTVKVIAIKDGKVVLLEQEQPNQPKFYDIPGGIHDHEAETELQAVQRELLEETGMSFRTWRLLSVTQPHRKIEQFVYSFLATDFENQIAQKLDAGDRISVRLLPFEDAKQLLSSKHGRFLPKEMGQTDSVEELSHLPEYIP